MRAAASTLAALLALALAAPASATKGLLGAWRAEKIERKGRVEPLPRGFELRTELHPKGRLVSVLRHDHGTKRREGTWKLVGSRRLRTRLEGQAEEVGFRLDGDALIFTNPKSGERLYLRRVR